MKIFISFDKKNLVFPSIVLLVGIVLHQKIEYQILILPLFVVLFALLLNIRLELKENIPWVYAGSIFLTGAGFTTFCVQFLLLERELFVKMQAHMWMLNIVCVLAVYCITQMFTAQVAWSCVIAHTGIVTLAFVNYFVYLFRQNEFSFSDLRAIGTGLSVASNYKLTLHDRGIYVGVLTLLFFAIVSRFAISFQKRRWMRLVCFLLALNCIIWTATRAIDINTETWEQKGTYRNGYVLNFLLGVRDSFVRAPKWYSQQFVQDMEGLYQKDGSSYVQAKPPKDPTIIVIMNESFSDLRVIGEMETNIPMMPFWESLTENTVRGYALASVFGAKTPNSEWEYMTGNTMAFLPEGSVVYQQYISQTPTSIVSTLKNIGYTCVAMHPYYETGWSRNVIYPNLGYDEMYFIDSFNQENIIRKYITDRELYDKIIQRYENRTSNEKLFLMGITMQNHGGYVQTYENFTEECYKVGRSYTDANQYISLVRESDDALKELIDYFSKVEEPVEIVFFGDHQPSLNKKFYSLLNGKGLTNLTVEERTNLYTVPFAIWTNYDSPEETMERTSLNYLSTMTLQRAGIELPPYYQFLADLRQKIPAIHANDYFSNTRQKMISVEDAKGEEKAWIQAYQGLQYNSMFDKAHRSKLFFPYIDKEGLN